MQFREILKETLWLLLTEQRVSYGRLRLEFDLSEEQLKGLRHELIEVKAVAADENGEFLVWFHKSHSQSVDWRQRAKAPSGTAQVEGPDSAQNTSNSAPTGSSLAEETASDAERRPLTVLFCDLADSTKLSTKLDPEDLQDVIRGYQERCTAIIQEYGGFVAKYMGDGILVYFGYPKSLERNAERALRAALSIKAAVPDLNRVIGRKKGVEIAVRIGVASGVVVVGEMVGEGLAQERTVIGEAPNVASRLQSIAPANGIAIGSLTKELAGPEFEYEDLGPRELKGITGKVAALLVTGLKGEPREGTATPETESAHELPQLLGRDEETGLLHRAWQSTKEENRGQVVVITGEAGIGKSVLVDGLSAQVHSEGGLRATFRCVPYHTGSALYPIIEHLKRLAGWQPEDPADVRLTKLESLLEQYNQPLEETVPHLAALFSLRLPDERYEPLDLSPQQQRQQTQDAIIALTLEEAERQPLLQIWEDLHWADPSTLELLGLLIEQAPTAGLMIVLTARPDFASPWPARSHVTPITLNRLERSHTEALVARIAGMKRLPAEVVDHIVAKTDGVPLYVEELTKTVLASNILRDAGERYELTGPLSSLSIPATLQDSLMARLDHLPQVREIAQLGAVLGREFAYEMISGLSTVGESSLKEGLGQLVDAELLYQRGRPPRAKYIFKHALVQDAAYQSLLKRGRRKYHEQVAEFLEARFPETVEAHPELLAHHFTQAGNEVRAVEYWLQAGQLATSRSANLEAIGSLRTGLKLLETLPDAPERLQQELDMQVTLGAVLMAAKGYGAPEVEQAYARADELSERLGDTSRRFAVIRGLLLCRLLRGETGKALDLARQLLALAETDGEPASLMLAHYMIAIVLVQRGEQASCQPHFAQALAIYDPREHADLAFQFGIDLGAAARNYSSWNLWLSGYPDQAVERIKEAFALHREISHPYSRAHSLTFAAALHQFRGEPDDARSHAEAAVELAIEQRYDLFKAVAEGLLGWSLVASGKVETGIEQMRQGFDAALCVGTLWRHYFLCLMAEAFREQGRRKMALEALDEGLQLMDRTGDSFWGPELHRLRGEILLECGDQEEGQAEECFIQALELARRQHARSLELRAATSLSRLRRQQGKNTKAREFLASVYDWFTEGHDTPDLKDAKQLLEELSGHKAA